MQHLIYSSAFNRTILELKAHNFENLNNNGFAFNRTILELKAATRHPDLKVWLTFNRTILELKDYNERNFSNYE